jgi:hypothetical protein
MRLAMVLIAAGALGAQTRMPVGIVRGDVVSLQGSATSGELRIKTPDDTTYACLYDVRTYFERDLHRIGISGLKPGEPVEVVADRTPGTSNCYARTVHVVDTHAQKLAPGARPRLRSSSSPTEAWAPRGNMNISGLVVQRAPYTLTLKTRTGTETLLLRPDTRYVGSGLRVAADSLHINQRVFIRAGRNLEGDVEAYQVMWGEITTPQ